MLLAISAIKLFLSYRRSTSRLIYVFLLGVAHVTKTENSETIKTETANKQRQVWESVMIRTNQATDAVIVNKWISRSLLAYNFQDFFENHYMWWEHPVCKLYWQRCSGWFMASLLSARPLKKNNDKCAKYIEDITRRLEDMNFTFEW